MDPTKAEPLLVRSEIALAERHKGCSTRECVENAIILGVFIAIVGMCAAAIFAINNNLDEAAYTAIYTTAGSVSYALLIIAVVCCKNCCTKNIPKLEAVVVE